MKNTASLWLGHKLRLAIDKLSGRPARFSALPAPQPEGPAGTVSCRPALFDPLYLSRVTKCAFGKSLPQLVEVLEAREYREAPLQRYELGPACVIGGLIFTESREPLLHSKFVHAGLKDALAGAPLSDRAVLANSMQGLRYFGHWLSDDVSAYEAHRDDPDLVSLPLPAWNDAIAYRALFEQDWRQSMVIRGRSLVLLRDLGFSRAKAGRYRALRERLRRNLGVVKQPDKVVFLKRGPSGDPREISNAAELEQALTAAGVTILTVEGDSRAMLAELVDASIIITIEGSQDRHAVYALREGGGMITLAPPDRFYVATHEWARCLDMHSGIIVGTPDEGGFRIDPGEVLDMVDRLMHRIDNREMV